MIRIEVRTGHDIASVLEDLARLRVAAFREWPYLYDGHASSETSYLRANSLDPALLELPAYRGKGVGHVFLDARERHARACGATQASFCAARRPRDLHPF